MILKTISIWVCVMFMRLEEQLLLHYIVYYIIYTHSYKQRRRRRKKPSWLQALLSETKFFTACSNGGHSSAKKNERNIFCLDCELAICQHCISTHSHHHKLLQVITNNYVYIYWLSIYLLYVYVKIHRGELSPFMAARRRPTPLLSLLVLG